MFLLAGAAFISYKNQQWYKEEIKQTNIQKDNLARTKQRLKTAIDTYDKTKAEREAVEEENIQLTKDEADQRESNEDLKQQITTKTRETQDNKARLDEIREKTARVGDICDLASKMRATSAELTELRETIEKNETQLDQLTNDNQRTEGEITDMKGMFETIAQNQSLPKLNARIRSIYSSWGFVTLSSGNDGGVVNSSMLDIVRNGEVIGHLLVTSVERNSAAASIVPDSLAEDVTLMVGDRVVPTKKQENPAPATAFTR